MDSVIAGISLLYTVCVQYIFLYVLWENDVFSVCTIWCQMNARAMRSQAVASC